MNNYEFNPVYEFSLEVGYNLISAAELVYERNPTKDYLKVWFHGGPTILIKPHHFSIDFTGDTKDAAFHFAKFIQHRASVSKFWELKEIIKFSQDWRIISDGFHDRSREFIEAYNKIINTVLLLS